MNLKELKISVDFFVEHLKGVVDIEDVPVLITLSESSIGARASAEIKRVDMGIDWEHGQFRIEPSKKLVYKGNSLSDIKNIIKHELGGQTFNACPHCIMKVAKDDCYCRHCGQRLR